MPRNATEYDAMPMFPLSPTLSFMLLLVNPFHSQSGKTVIPMLSLSNKTDEWRTFRQLPDSDVVYQIEQEMLSSEGEGEVQEDDKEEIRRPGVTASEIMESRKRGLSTVSTVQTEITNKESPSWMVGYHITS
jgi:hypothetical protein